MSFSDKPEISTDFGTEMIINLESHKQQDEQSYIQSGVGKRMGLTQDPPGYSEAKKRNNRYPFFQINNPPLFNLIGIFIIFTVLIMSGPGNGNKLSISISFKEFLLLVLYPGGLAPEVLAAVDTRFLFGLAALYVPISFVLSGLMIVFVECIGKARIHGVSKSRFTDVLQFIAGITSLMLLLYPVGVIWFGWPFAWFERIIALMIYFSSLFITINAFMVG